MITENQILDVLSGVLDPELGRNLVELGMIRDVKVSPDNLVSFTIALTVTGCPLKGKIEEDARAAVMKMEGVKDVHITLSEMTADERQSVFSKTAPQGPRLKDLNKIGRVVAVMSGKGGVGKSSVTALLACQLACQGKKVGILDADITGPSIPKLFGLPAGGARGSDQGILPSITSTGIRVMSANLLVPTEEVAIIWRGPLIGGIIKQFWNDVLWGTLDVLLVDLPPGTSDAALTVMQTLPVNGVVMVSTPQQLAGLVVRKADSMLKQLGIPVLGVVENMSFYACAESGVQHEIFGPSHVEELAAAIGTTRTARLAIDSQITLLGDAGRIEAYNSPELEPLTEILN